MKIWFRLVKNNKKYLDEVIEINEDISRTKKIFTGLETICHKWDLAVPIWLDSTINDFKRRSHARFLAESFPEQVDFDYLEIQVTEE